MAPSGSTPSRPSPGRAPSDQVRHRTRQRVASMLQMAQEPEGPQTLRLKVLGTTRRSLSLLNEAICIPAEIDRAISPQWLERQSEPRGASCYERPSRRRVTEHSGWPTKRRPGARRRSKTVRGRSSASLATASSGCLTLSNILERYWTIGDSRSVDLFGGGSSAFESWRLRISCSTRGRTCSLGTRRRLPRRLS